MKIHKRENLVKDARAIRNVATIRRPLSNVTDMSLDTFPRSFRGSWESNQKYFHRKKVNRNNFIFQKFSKLFFVSNYVNR